MIPDRWEALRELIGTAAIERITGLSRRDVQRIGAGAATLHADTAAKLRAALTRAARMAGGVGETRRIAEQVAARFPRSVSCVRIALYLHEQREAVSFAAICEALTGDRDSSPIQEALRQLADAGLIAVEPGPDHHLAKRARWVG